MGTVSGIRLYQFISVQLYFAGNKVTNFGIVNDVDSFKPQKQPYVIGTHVIPFVWMTKVMHGEVSKVTC